MRGNFKIKHSRLKYSNCKKLIMTFLGISIMCAMSGLLFSPCEISALESFWEHEFSSQVRDVAFRDTDKAQVFPVSAVSTEKEIIFYDEKGNEMKKHKLQPGEEGVLARDGTLYAIQKHRKGDLSLDIERIELFNYQNSQTEAIKASGQVMISPDNKYLVISSLKDNYIDFYSISGELLNHHSFYQLKGYQIEFSKDGELCIASVAERSEESEKGKQIVLTLYDRTGKELWRFNESKIEGRVAISSDGGNFVFASEEMVYSFSFDQKDNRVKVVWQQTLPSGGIDVAISDDGKYVTVTREANHRVMMFDNSNGRLMWRYDLEDDLVEMKSPFTSVEFFAKGLIITAQLSGDISNKKSFLFELDFNGKLTTKKCIISNQLKTFKNQNGKFYGLFYVKNLSVYSS